MDRYQKDLIDHLSGFVTRRRLQKIDKVLSRRTRYLTLALEDIFQPQNASAVIRTCESFGIQDLYVIENRNEFQVDREVTLGSNQWINIHTYRKGEHSTEQAIQFLKGKGYRIIATSPGSKYRSPDRFDIEAGKSTLLFGTEMTGLSEQALSLADEFLTVPMQGFTESFNISVAAGIILYELRKKLDRSSINWQLPEEEYLETKLAWLRGNIKRDDLIENKFKANYRS